MVQSAPALFTVNAAGAGAAAAQNQDGSLNSAQNPAARGSIVVLYGTGEGSTTPEGIDGQIAASVFPKPVLPVSVTVGGQPVEVLYAGAAPGLVAGIFQINARIPLTSPTGEVAVVVTVGPNSSPAAVTLSVRAH